jgi:hypothetical protein
LLFAEKTKMGKNYFAFAGAKELEGTNIKLKKG